MCLMLLSFASPVLGRWIDLNVTKLPGFVRRKLNMHDDDMDGIDALFLNINTRLFLRIIIA